ncbi:type IV toxin-antitoxin system AbiEi family antitoxin [Agromyces sp. NPDC056523]|uniref:type IV toxin-antitoxin system AbiEi family antitoxin n=1 Tax=Agromyces sp. NPDC056523 TaxID=3345850 RepID=UPI00366D524B
MARLPTVLGTDDLPLAELCAARLDGELFRLGGGWCPIDEPDLPALRAAAIGPDRPSPMIIERRSAAWVYGALPRPPQVAEYCVPHESRVAARNDLGHVVREVAIDESDVAEYGGIRCTTVERTVFDLVRDVAADEAATIDTVRALLTAAPWVRDRVQRRVASAHRLPHRAMALRRLAGALDDAASSRR